MSADISHFQASLSDAHTEASQYLAGINSGKPIDTASFHSLVGKLSDINAKVSDLNKHIAGGGMGSLGGTALSKLNAQINDTHKQLSDINSVVQQIIYKAPGPALIAVHETNMKSADKLEEVQRNVTDLMKSRLQPPPRPSRPLSGRVRPEPPAEETVKRERADTAPKAGAFGAVPPPRTSRSQSPPAAGRPVPPSVPSRDSRPQLPAVDGGASVPQRAASGGSVKKAAGAFKDMPIMGVGAPPPAVKGRRAASAPALPSPPRSSVSDSHSAPVTPREVASSSSASAAASQRGPLPDSLVGRKIFFLVEYLEKNPTSMKEEGIFRLSGVKTTNQQVREGLDDFLKKVGDGSKKDPRLPSGIGIHTISSLIKESVEALARGSQDGSTPGIPDGFFFGLGNAIGSESIEEKDAVVAENVALLTAEQKMCLGKIFSYLVKVEENVGDTKMAASNLAIVFAPRLFPRQEQALVDLNNPMLYMQGQPAMQGAFIELFEFYKRTPDSFK